MMISVAPRPTLHTKAPADLIDTGRYALDDFQARAAVVRKCRDDIARDGSTTLEGFLRPEAIAAMVAEIEDARARAYRRDVLAPVYGGDAAPPGATADHPRNRRHWSRMNSLAADQMDGEGPISRLYRWAGMTRMIADIMDRLNLHRLADPMLCCNVTMLGPGDAHAWHFDGNDFVVTLLLQRAERGGLFEYAPFVRGPDRENYEDVARILDETPGSTRVIDQQPGTLALFCGKYSVHRVTEVAGSRERLIALFSYDERPDMHFSEATKLSTFGRTAPIASFA